MSKWKDIPEYKGLYQASENGEIKSLPRQGSLRTIIPKTNPNFIADIKYGRV